MVGAIALTTLLGCAQAPLARSFALTLDRGAEAAVPVLDAGAPPSPPAGGSYASAATPAPAPTPASGSGGGGAPASPGDPARPSGSFLVLSDGRIVPVPEGGTVDLPAGTTGEVSLFMPGRVPSTLELAAPGPLPALHPLADSIPGEPLTTADISGALASPEAGVSVSYMASGHRTFTGATSDGFGVYAFSVPLEAPEEGLLVAREASGWPQLAVVPLALQPGQTVGAPSLMLAAPTGIQPPAPAVPLGMTLSARALRVSTGAPGARPMTVLSVNGDHDLPAYDLPGLEVTLRYDASSPDGRAGSTVVGPPGLLPSFLAAPDLTALSGPLKPASRLAWPAVPGATLYVVWLADAVSSATPLWEAVTTDPAVSIPRWVPLAGHELLLQVQAWDAPEVSAYSVAGLRQLRVPTDLPGPTGRTSRAIRKLAP